MKVKQLIELLQECDQDLPVYIYADDEIHEIVWVDDSISDRVDLNMEEEPDAYLTTPKPKTL